MVLAAISLRAVPSRSLPVRLFSLLFASLTLGDPVLPATFFPSLCFYFYLFFVPLSLSL